MGVTFIAPQGTYTAPAKLVSKSITENGTYDPADDNANGYSSVKVEVEGGGGSSDFSTANLTLINNSRESLSITIPTCFESTDAPFGFPFITSFTNEVASNETATFKVALYKATALLTGMIGNITTSGNVTYNEEYGIYIVTGDCTITIS